MYYNLSVGSRSMIVILDLFNDGQNVEQEARRCPVDPKRNNISTSTAIPSRSLPPPDFLGIDRFLPRFLRMADHQIQIRVRPQGRYRGRGRVLGQRGTGTTMKVQHRLPGRDTVHPGKSDLGSMISPIRALTMEKDGMEAESISHDLGESRKTGRGPIGRGSIITPN